MNTAGIVFLLWVFPMIVAWKQGVEKNRMGLAWGLCLGWVGVIILAILPPVAPHGTA